MTSHPPSIRLIHLKALRQIVPLSEGTIAKHCSRAEDPMPHVWVGCIRLFDADAVLAWLARQPAPQRRPGPGRGRKGPITPTPAPAESVA